MISYSLAFISTLAISFVAAHGGIRTPTPITGALPQNPTLANFKTIGTGCGANVPAGAATVTWPAGSTQDLTFFVLNGDGAGPVAAALDTTGKGQFQGAAKVTVVQQVTGTNGRGGKKGDNAMTIQVPNTPCTNCLVQIKNAVGFGSCVKVNIVAAGGVAAPAAPVTAATAARVAAAPVAGQVGAAPPAGQNKAANPAVPKQAVTNTATTANKKVAGKAAAPTAAAANKKGAAATKPKAAKQAKKAKKTQAAAPKAGRR
ncbi:hypothetical protein HDU98_000942 [Podochytrium sp. JEL0797]|nr:hypothetical protein HDU98_000942 [Podochytrium sp. JEL0797]